MPFTSPSSGQPLASSAAPAEQPGIMFHMGPQLRRRHGRETFEVGHVPGVNGVVLSDFSFWTGLGIVVDGQRVKPSAFTRRVLLPGTPRNIEARVRGLLPGGEKLLVDGQAYPTGPVTSLALRWLAVLPVLAVLLARPPWGLLVALLATNLNTGVIRSRRPEQVKLALMLACTAAAVAVALTLSAAYGFPLGS